MTVTLRTNPWADAYNAFAAGEYRHVSLSLLDENMAKGGTRRGTDPCSCGLSKICV